MKPRALFEISGLLLILLVGVLAYLFVMREPEMGTDTLSLQACDPGQTVCAVDLPGGGAVEFRLFPQPVPLLKPFSVEARVFGVNVHLVEVDFSADGMDMGYQRPRLLDQGKGVFLGTASLPVCITGSMNWRASLIIEANGQRWSIPFLFSTHT